MEEQECGVNGPAAFFSVQLFCQTVLCQLGQLWRLGAIRVSTQKKFRSFVVCDEVRLQVI
jgi:hypothetical protein